jgi:hypothetical protein
MNAESINRWLSLSANLGVVIGLVLLLIELDQNSDLVRAQIHQARSDEHVGYRIELANSEYLLPARLKVEEAGGFANPNAMDDLTAEEAYRIRELLAARHQDYDNLFYQYQQGYLDEEFYMHRVASSIRYFAPWWKKLDIFETYGRRPSFHAEIQRIVENVAE